MPKISPSTAFLLRLSVADHRKLQAAAKRAGEKLSPWVRSAALAAAVAETKKLK